MESVRQIISNISVDDNSGIKRIVYMPYQQEIARTTWKAIAEKIIGNVTFTEENKILYAELIQYIHGDPAYCYDLNKAIGILGPTGTGKTKSMEIMNKYSEIDDVKYYLNGKSRPFKFYIFNSRDICEDFATNGYDGLLKYCNYSTICIDDLGTENQNVQYFGTKVNVIEEIIEERYRKQLLTHFTSNFTKERIGDVYGDRVYSRIIGTTNIHNLKGKDFRLLT
jgi:DNA replication protein DnaC